MSELTTCLWFDTDGEDAAEFYASVFADGKVGEVTRYGPAAPGPEGHAMTVEFEILGQKFVALNGGKQDWAFSEAISFQVPCADQAEVDRYWDALGEGGEHGPCGWLKDRFGVSWQIVPTRLPELLRNSDPETAQRVMAAMLKMGKIEIAELEAAAAA